MTMNTTVRVDDTKEKMNECTSMPDSQGTKNTAARSLKSVSNRSHRSNASYKSRKSNQNMCTNDFVVVGGGGLATIDISLPRQK